MIQITKNSGIKNKINLKLCIFLIYKGSSEGSWQIIKISLASPNGDLVISINKFHDKNSLQ